MEIRQVASRVVYENRWMRVREDEVRRADGSRGTFGVVEKPDFALIVPLAADGGLFAGLVKDAPSVAAYGLLLLDEAANRA